MVGLSLSKQLMALAILLMPFSYATKYILGFPNMVWIDPTLILSLGIFFLTHTCYLPRITLTLIVLAFFSACLGFFLLPSMGLYDVFREPFRLFLNIIWFWVCVFFFRKHEKFTLKLLAWSVTLQLLVAIFLWAMNNGFLPPWIDFSVYDTEFKEKQLIWINGFPLQRLMGTFWEGPPFGLFMFCCFSIYYLKYFAHKERAFFIKSALIISGIGIIGSLADQIFLGLAILTVTSSFIILCNTTNGYKIVSLVIILLFASTLSWYIYGNLQDKFAEMGDFGNSAYVFGTSVGERWYHANNGINIIEDMPVVIVTGIGPGRYGDYASKTGIWPSTVTMQFTLAEWIVEYGIIWSVIICILLVSVARKAFIRYRYWGWCALLAILTANGFQANWKWEAWFMVLAFLYSSPKCLVEKGRMRN